MAAVLELDVEDTKYTVEYTNDVWTVTIFSVEENESKSYIFESVPSVARAKSNHELNFVGLSGKVDFECGYAHYLFLEDRTAEPRGVPLSKKGYDTIKEIIDNYNRSSRDW